MKYSSINALAYVACLWLIELNPAYQGNVWIKRIMRWCLPDWVEWKTEQTLKEVDRQVDVITEEWRSEDNQKVVETFQEIYPEAKVSTHDEKTGAVLIEHPPNGSKAQDLLGGAMEIRSPWSEGKM